jgi:hypothetical protein
MFSNGNLMTSKNMSLTFSVDQTNGDQHLAKLSVNFGAFFNETTGNATISNGRLMIDSIPSIFFVSPALLTDGDDIQLYQTESRTLEGTVRKTGLPPTAIGDYRVTSKMVSANLQTNSSESPGGYLSIGFDPETGDFILGGTFELISYSENLGFDLVVKSQFLIWGIIVIFVIILSCVITVLVYKSLKKKTNRKFRTEKHKKLLRAKY